KHSVSVSKARFVWVMDYAKKYFPFILSGRTITDAKGCGNTNQKCQELLFVLKNKDTPQVVPISNAKFGGSLCK
ncbi:hypothetical protein MKW98_025899, partial [Papaver atlanticum]